MSAKKYIAISEHGGTHITPGKEYEVIRMFKKPRGKGAVFFIKDNDYKTAYCLEFGCAHIDDNDWLIKKVK